MNGLGGAAGVLLGGIITEVLSWRWVLLINPPIAIVAALVAYVVVAERRTGRDAARFDLAGALTLTIGQMVLVYGVVEAGLKGWEHVRRRSARSSSARSCSGRSAWSRRAWPRRR